MGGTPIMWRIVQPGVRLSLMRAERILNNLEVEDIPAVSVQTGGERCVATRGGAQAADPLPRLCTTVRAGPSQPGAKNKVEGGR